MQKIILAAALAGSALAGSASARVFTESTESQKYMFKAFKAEHGKSYATMVEEENRFNAFVENLKIIDARNDAEPTATRGIPKFADVAVTEFKRSLSNVRPADWNSAIRGAPRPPGRRPRRLDGQVHHPR